MYNKRHILLWADAVQPYDVECFISLNIHAEPPATGEFAPRRDEIARALREHGHLHIPYEGALFAYGHAWHTPDHIGRAFATASDDGVRLVSHHPRGWDDHQDVLAFRREP